MKEASEKLELSSSVFLAYADTDRKVYVEDLPKRTLYLHHNIDLFEGCAYATVLTKGDAQFVKADVYLVEMGIGDNQTKPASSHVGDFLLDVYFTREGWIRHADLVSAVKSDDELPTYGRALSFDIPTGHFQFSSLVFDTGFISYLPLMIEGDLEVLSNAANGEFEEWGTEFLIYDEDGEINRVEPSEYCKGLALRENTI